MSKSDFSLLQKSMQAFEQEINVKKELMSAPPFSDADMKKEAQDLRKARALKDYWYFDKIYFPESMYSGGYSAPSSLHKAIVKLMNQNGVNVVFGPRKHGKTITAKKALLWSFLTSKHKFGGTMSETIDKAQFMLSDIAEFMLSNERIIYDFKPDIKINNVDNLQFRFIGAPEKNWRYLQPFSERRSVRGSSHMFLRPTILLGDDIETLESSMQLESVEMRLSKLAEAFQSLTEGKSSFLILGNDFNRNSALHRLKLEQERGLLAKSWHVYSFKAWDNNRPLWLARYPNVKTESELKAILQPRSESDWEANFQQNPVPPEGYIFQQKDYLTYEKLPNDARRGVLYCDPNLSKKGMGDTTGITVLKWSREKQKYYVVAGRCKSFKNSIELLDAIYDLCNKHNIHAIAMDGFVAQESNWSDFIRNWSRTKGRPFPIVEFKRYHVDELAKSVQASWVQGDILFPSEFSKTEEGKRYCDQVFAFRGKRSNNKDDAPDSLICAHTYMHERHYDRRGENLLLTGAGRDFSFKYKV